MIIFLLPISLIVFTEIIRHRRRSNCDMTNRFYEINSDFGFKKKVRVDICIGDLYIILGFFLLGAVSTDILTNLGKNTIARMRPCFIEMCKPSTDVKLFCNQINGNYSSYVKLSDLRCKREPSYYSDYMKSFPSGHSSMSFYPMVF